MFIFLVALVSVLGTLIRSDKSKNANNQILSIAAKKPGFEVDVLIFNNEEEQVGIFEKWWNGGSERVENATALAEGTGEAKAFTPGIWVTIAIFVVEQILKKYLNK